LFPILNQIWLSAIPFSVKSPLNLELRKTGINASKLSYIAIVKRFSKYKKGFCLCMELEFSTKKYYKKKKKKRENKTPIQQKNWSEIKKQPVELKF